MKRVGGDEPDPSRYPVLWYHYPVAYAAMYGAPHILLLVLTGWRTGLLIGYVFNGVVGLAVHYTLRLVAPIYKVILPRLLMCVTMGAVVGMMVTGVILGVIPSSNSDEGAAMGGGIFIFAAALYNGFVGALIGVHAAIRG